MNDTLDLPTSPENTAALDADLQATHLWLADEDAALGNELQHPLSHFGFELSPFTRLADVCAAARNGQPDLLLLNVAFPAERLDATVEMSMHPALRALRCPVIFIAEEAGFAVRLRAVRAGGQGLLVKPLDTQKLVGQIEQVLYMERKIALRVLIVESNAALADHYAQVLLAAGMEADVLHRPQALIEWIAAFRPDLVLMDMHLHECNGRDLTAVIRQLEEWVGLSIIYLSSEDDRDLHIRVMNAGADDFLVKPVADAHLVAAIKARARRAQQLSDLVARDGLTNLLRHAGIKEALEIEWRRAQRNGTPLAVVVIGIDCFKEAGANGGRALADRIIRAAAHLLKQRLRQSDIVGHHGEDGFALLLPECDPAAALAFMNDLRNRFAALRFHGQNDDFNCTLSAGVSCTTIKQDATAAELLHQAEEALHVARHDGHNRVSIARVARHTAREH
jgi:diguanylate cyclase (GGDEF)-like protein